MTINVSTSRAGRTANTAARVPSAEDDAHVGRAPADKSHPASSAFPRARRVGHQTSAADVAECPAVQGVAAGPQQKPEHPGAGASAPGCESETNQGERLMANRTESQPSHKDRALEALADSAQEFGGPSAAAQRATAHATLAAAEQLEQLCTVLRSSLALQQAAELRMAGARR